MRERLPALDALRGIAALCVVLFHVILRYPYFMQGLDVPQTLLFAGAPNGFYLGELGLVPVLWFFIISGFVITWTIDRCRTPMDFVVSRFSRLYPAYWAALLVTLILDTLAPLPDPGITLSDFLVNLTMAQDFVGVPSLDGVFWSLGVELHFYVLMLAVFAIGQWRRVHLAVFAWTLLAFAAAAIQATGHWFPWRLQGLLVLPYAPLLATGMMLYQLWRRHHPAWSAATLAVALLTLFLTVRPAAAATCLAVAALIALSTKGRLRWLAARPLLFLGSISYALYLSHQTAAFAAMAVLDQAGLPHRLGMAIAVLLALLLAIAITFAIERPALHAIRSLWRSRAASPVRPPPAPPLAASAAPAAIPPPPSSPG